MPRAGTLQITTKGQGTPSTLLDWRDWPSYVYLVVGFVLLFYLPLHVYQLYQKSQLQADIINAIASGDPDIRQILELAKSDPTSDWVGEEVLDKVEPSEASYEGLKILRHSRIYDLRRRAADEETLERRGHVYVRARITLKFLDSYDGDGHVVLVSPIKLQNVEFRQPNPELRGTIRRVTVSAGPQGERSTAYEFEYDFSQVLPDEPVTIEVELIGEAPTTVRAPFVLHTKTDLISAWLLFPADRTYSLVSYPRPMSQSPKIMNNRYAIDHPYGSLIGWSVVNPAEDRVYECAGRRRDASS